MGPSTSIAAILLLLSAACGDDGGDPDGSAMDGATDGMTSMDAFPDGTTTDSAPGDSATGDGTVGDASPDATVAPPGLPPANASFDYQLGEAYPPPSGVMVVSRDRNASPASGIYNICYVNGFQTQPDERDFWMSDHPDLLLRDSSGDLVIDPDWDEIILDVTTPEKRAMLAEIVGGWIDGCATDGFDAVEIDNLDTYARSGGLVSEDHAVSFMALLSARAHAAGLAIAQKNSTDVLGRRAEMGTDFAVAEECNRYDECADYTDVYGDQVYVIEYRRTDFDAGCRDFPNLSIVLRDLDLVGPGSGGYVYDGC
jgi:hypothetical protein